MNSNSPANRGFRSVYMKLNENGTLDPRPLEASDYDSLVNFIKFSFPTTARVQRTMEDTLKRTFVLARTDSKSKSKLRNKRRTDNALGSLRKRKNSHFQAVRAVPPKLVYSEFLQLNTLWKAYVTDILEPETKVFDIQQKLNRIDLHGAVLKVVDSRCASYVDLEGIVVKETKNTFVIVTSSNTTKTLPKADSIFSVVIPSPGGVMQITGNTFISRPAERSSKKIKSFMENLRPKTYRRNLLTQGKH